MAAIAIYLRTAGGNTILSLLHWRDAFTTSMALATDVVLVADSNTMAV
jgi:hypothetical protein